MPGGGDGAGPKAMGIEGVIKALINMVPAQPRPIKGPFLFSVDHCFALKGQGSVLTGTVLSGSLKVHSFSHFYTCTMIDMCRTWGVSLQKLASLTVQNALTKAELCSWPQ